MAGTWLYTISKRPKFHFFIGGKQIPVTIASYRDLIQTRRLKEDTDWNISQNWKHVHAGDTLYIYTGDEDYGIIGFATVVRVKKHEPALDLKFDLEKCKLLLKQPIPAKEVRNWKLNLRRNVVDLSKVASRLESLLPWNTSHRRDKLEQVRATADDQIEFDPTDLTDARQRIESLIVMRQGQAAFRNQLLEAYGRRCAITGCEVVDVLDASHIVPYRGPKTNESVNGLLLRTDIHALFDLNLMAIHPKSRRLVVSKVLAASEYEALSGKQLYRPARKDHQPNVEALTWAWKAFCKREATRKNTCARS